MTGIVTLGRLIRLDLRRLFGAHDDKIITFEELAAAVRAGLDTVPLEQLEDEVGWELELAIRGLLEQHGSLAYEQIAALLERPPEAVRNALTGLRDRRFVDVLPAGRCTYSGGTCGLRRDPPQRCDSNTAYGDVLGERRFWSHAPGNVGRPAHDAVHVAVDRPARIKLFTCVGACAEMSHARTRGTDRGE
jgi:hypothetical protein